MRDTSFFEPVQQIRTTTAGYECPSPVFYYDMMSVSAMFATPLDRVRSLLPSERLHPLTIAPRKAVTAIGFIEYRDSDIGPYNELTIGFPVTIDRRAPMLIGMLRGMKTGSASYVWHLPVTTEIARDLGIAVAGYPKILADITIDDDDEWIHCRAAAAGQEILNLSIRKPKTKRVNRRWPSDILTTRERFVQRTPAVSNVRHMGASMKADDAQLETGDHPIGAEVDSLELGRVLGTGYLPDSQLILAAPIDGWVASRTIDRPAYPQSEPRTQSG